MTRNAGPADPTTPIEGTGCELVEFWRWAYSDLVSNDVRGVFAEYLVGVALGVADGTRVSWAAHDLTYRGAGIEVKATGDRQAWQGPPTQRISWSIRGARAWDADEGRYAPTPSRSAAAYVLCHWRGEDDGPLAPATTQTWDFYVVATTTLDRLYPDAKSISLGAVKRLVADGEAASCNYGAIRDVIDVILDN